MASIITCSGIATQGTLVNLPRPVSSAPSRRDVPVDLGMVRAV